MSHKLPPRIVQAVVDLADSLIDSAESQLASLKSMGHNSPKSPMFGQYTYWKNYRSAMRDIRRIAQSRIMDETNVV